MRQMLEKRPKIHLWLSCFNVPLSFIIKAAAEGANMKSTEHALDSCGRLKRKTPLCCTISQSFPYYKPFLHEGWGCGGRDEAIWFHISRNRNRQLWRSLAQHKQTGTVQFCMFPAAVWPLSTWIATEIYIHSLHMWTEQNNIGYSPKRSVHFSSMYEILQRLFLACYLFNDFPLYVLLYSCLCQDKRDAVLPLLLYLYFQPCSSSKPTQNIHIFPSSSVPWEHKIRKLIKTCQVKQNENIRQKCFQHNRKKLLKYVKYFWNTHASFRKKPRISDQNKQN